MRGPIEGRIAALRGQVRRLLALHGLSWLAFGLVSAILAAGSVDWLVNLAPEVRLVLLAGVIGLGLWLAVRRVVMPLVVRFADLDIALRIEERWPGLNDRLASTVQFLRSAKGQDDRLGSQALRDATVEQTLVEVDKIDFRQVADPRSARKAAAWAVAVLAVMGTVAAVEPDLSGIALRRLFRPYGPDRWPQVTHLRILDETPTRLARGMHFTLAVAVAEGERPPSSARVTYIYPDGETSTEPLRPTDDGTFRGRIDSVSRPFRFTVAAGDDVTEPRSVEVVPPPSLEATTVRVVAPAYTALKAQTLAPGNTQVRAVEGSRIEFEARANKPIASALLRRGDAVAKEGVKIADGGRALATSFGVKESQPFWIELKDTEGFGGQEVIRFELRSTKDEAPRVAMEEPSHDRDVPPGATIPVRIAVDDDFGIQLVRLVYKVASGHSEPTREEPIPLWAAPEPHGEAGPVKHREVEYRWDLSALKDLQPGSIVSFYAEARDFDNLKGPNIGRSREMRLRIVSREDIDRLLDEQKRAIREEAERVLAIEKQAKTPVDDALRAFEDLARLPEPLRDQVKNAEVIQRQAGNRVTNPSDGLDKKIRQLRDDTRDFKVQDADTDRQLAEMAESVRRIKDRLGPAEQALTRANKSLERPQDGDKPAPPDAAARPPENPDGRPQPDQPRGEATKGEATKGAQSQGAQAKADQSKGQAPPDARAPDDQPKADGQDQQPAGADAKGAQPKAKGDQSKGQQSKGAQAKADPKGQSPADGKPAGDPQTGQPEAAGQDQQPAGADAKGRQGEASKGEQSKGQASKGQQSKGQASKGQQAKGADPKASKPQAEAGGDKPAPDEPGDQAPPRPALAEAEKDQKAIVDELQKMLDGLSRFDDVQKFVKDAKSLLQQQEQAMKRSAEAADRPGLKAKSPEELTPEQAADLKNDAARQEEIAQGLQKLESKLSDKAKEIEATDPLTSRALKDAAEKTRKQATGAKMGEAADQLRKNQMAQAQAGQAQARRDLKQMLDEIENRRERELSRLVAELKAAEADLKKARDKQAANLKKTNEARQIADPQKRADELKKLAKEQQQLQEDLKKQLQKLAKLNAEAGARAGQKAAESMAKAQGQLEQDQGEQAAADEEEALQDLKQAQEEVADARKEAEEQLAMEQIAKMADALKSIGERQNKMVEETARYEKVRADNDGKLSFTQGRSVGDLGQVQDGLKDEATELGERLGEGAPVFHLTLKKAAEAMDAAARRLRALKTDEPTLRAEKLAAARFQQLIDSLKPDKPRNGGGQQPPGGGPPGGQPGGNRGGDGIPAAAQIKMLKSLQQELNERTDFYDEMLRRQKELNPDQTAELDKLHVDQGALADLVRDLTRPKKDDGEE